MKRRDKNNSEPVGLPSAEEVIELMLQQENTGDLMFDAIARFTNRTKEEVKAMPPSERENLLNKFREMHAKPH